MGSLVLGEVAVLPPGQRAEWVLAGAPWRAAVLAEPTGGFLSVVQPVEWPVLPDAAPRGSLVAWRPKVDQPEMDSFTAGLYMEAEPKVGIHSS